MTETSCDILIAGGGTGGCAAAMAACSMGLKVVMTEETAWIGGQLTSQAVPPDEHPWIEQFGCTRRYRDYRDRVRQFYRQNTPLKPQDAHFNPGGGWVSRLCHEPRIGWLVLQEMVRSEHLDLRLGRVPIRADSEGNTVRSVMFLNMATGEEEIVHTKYVLDATELGDLLQLTRTEYVTGAESRQETGEPNAVSGDAELLNVQGITWCAALAHDEGSHRVIDRPEQYDKWRAYKPDFWPGPLLGFDVLHAHNGLPVKLPLFANDWYALFPYRLIVDPAKFEGYEPHPVTIVNWPQNDYFEGNIIDETPEVVRQRLHDARQLTLSLIYWLQTDALRHDGGVGYPGLYLRPDMTGTEDGLAMAPYIRESRRIKARFTVTEQMVSESANPGRDRALEFKDSVGIGSYRIDLHPSADGKNTIDCATVPFQIPLGSLIPVATENLLPACKNLGVTHITNGCYRLHPVEWNIGEAAGLLVAYCVQQNTTPEAVLSEPSDYQRLLTLQGIELEWPEKLG